MIQLAGLLFVTYVLVLGFALVTGRIAGALHRRSRPDAPPHEQAGHPSDTSVAAS